MNYKVIPIPDEISSAVRRTMISPQYKSLAANASLANGYGPCRSCLRVFDRGTDRRIYFTYNSFEGRSELPDPGPVFIHENRCEPYEQKGFPEDLKGLPVVIEAFGPDGLLVSRTPLAAERADEQIDILFSQPEVGFINLRNASVGCFIATVERDL